MKLTTKFFAAALALTAATGAFAASDDGASDSAWLQQATSAYSRAQAPAPAPTAAAAPAPVGPVVDTSNQISLP